MSALESGLVLRRLYPTDSGQMLALIRPALATTPYCSRMSDPALQRACFAVQPETVHEVRWFGQQVLGLLRDDHLHGFIDIGLGFDDESLGQSGEKPLGLLRFLALPPEFPFALHVGRQLLDAADAYWRQAQISRVRAFAYGLGYADFQGGTGLLPGSWAEHRRLLEEKGYVATDRYYCFRYPLRQSVKEPLPEAALSFVPTATADARVYQLFDGPKRAAFARFSLRDVIRPQGERPVAYLSHLRVEEPWRQKGLGRWLLRRLLNDATLLGCREMCVHISQRNRIALRLVSVLGFEETDYRGYGFEKRLDGQTPETGVPEADPSEPL